MLYNLKIIVVAFAILMAITVFIIVALYLAKLVLFLIIAPIILLVVYTFLEPVDKKSL